MIMVMNMAPASVAHLFTLTHEELSFICHHHNAQDFKCIAFSSNERISVFL